MKRIIYVPFDHLHRKFGALKDADPAVDVIAIVESARMTTGRNWHKERLFFLISSARHFAQLLEAEGFTVEYIKAATTIDGLKVISEKHKGLAVVCAEPSSFRQYEALKKHGVTFVENDFFLTPRTLFKEWADGQKNYLMENFYRKQRVRLNVLMDGTKPTGGEWNFDNENRLPPPKKYEGPAYLEHVRDEIDQQVAKEIGHTPTTTWATTREGALKQLTSFIDNHFGEFGPLEDAMTTDNWALHHSLLSLRVGDDACPFTTLYWDFLDRHKEEFAKNHRMSQQVFGLKRLTDLPELKVRAQQVLTGLEQGMI